MDIVGGSPTAAILAQEVQQRECDLDEREPKPDTTYTKSDYAVILFLGILSG